MHISIYFITFVPGNHLTRIHMTRQELIEAFCNKKGIVGNQRLSLTNIALASLPYTIPSPIESDVMRLLERTYLKVRAKTPYIVAVQSLAEDMEREVLNGSVSP